MDIQRLISEYLPEAVSADLSAMERELARICSGAGELAEPLMRINASGGKRLRPLLARVSRCIAGERGEIVPLMAMLELMHTTSLIHDDFVDGAELRRDVPTVNSREGWHMSLQCGDYLLAKAMEYLETYRGTGINELLSEVSQEMCLGELDQRAGLWVTEGMTEEKYLLRIKRKTALLMSASCQCGAMAAGADESVCNALGDYGMALGYAFQLRDDLMDWQPEKKTGKPPLQDLRSGVITLPMLLTDSSELMEILEKREKTPAHEERALKLFERSDAADRSKEKLRFYGDEAQRALDKLPKSGETKALGLLARAITEVKI